MSSVIPATRAWLPALVLPQAPARRRAAVAAAGLVVLAVTAAIVWLPGLPWRHGPAARHASAADIAVAHARAVERARARAKVAGSASAAQAPVVRAASARVADASNAGDLFASHSWYVAPPPPPPPAAVAPPPPTAPPFPYSFVGSFAPAGETPVYFLARSDRVLDARVGDKIDGVFEFESANAGQLVFNYLPLNIRQSLPTGASP